MEVLDLVLAEDNTLYVCLNAEEAIDYYEECIKKMSKQNNLSIEHVLLADSYDSYWGRSQREEYSHQKAFYYESPEYDKQVEYSSKHVWMNIEEDFKSYHRTLDYLMEYDKMELVGPEIAKIIEGHAAHLVAHAQDRLANLLSSSPDEALLLDKFSLIKTPFTFHVPEERLKASRAFNGPIRVLELFFDSHPDEYRGLKQDLSIRYRPLRPEQMSEESFEPRRRVDLTTFDRLESLRRIRSATDSMFSYQFCDDDGDWKEKKYMEYSNNELKAGKPTKALRRDLATVEEAIREALEAIDNFDKELKKEQAMRAKASRSYKALAKGNLTRANNSSSDFQNLLLEFDKKLTKERQKWQSLLPEMDKIAKVAENDAKSQLSAQFQKIEKTGYGHGETSKGGKEKFAYTDERAARYASQKEAEETANRTKKDAILKRVYRKEVSLSEHKKQMTLIKKELEQLLAKEGFKNYEICLDRYFEYGYNRHRRGSIVITANDLEHRRHEVYVDCDEERTYYFLTSSSAIPYIFEPK